MRRGFLLPIIAAGCVLFGQEDDSTAAAEARQQADRVRTLAEAGVVPRRLLEKAERELADARDRAILDKTLYSASPLGDLTADQMEAMIAAAQRLVERHEAQLELTRATIEQGALPRNKLQPEEDEMRKRQETLALALRRGELFLELEAIVLAEREMAAALERGDASLGEWVELFPSGEFSPLGFMKIQDAFEAQFGRQLPVSAYGATALHRSMGFDHRGRVDVALHPDRPEGRWLRELLERMDVPYIAYRARVEGKSTGAHIHIGPPSPRVARSD